tara:strand:+ start:381 stop:1517 length:1137 start_codon:yes stop_codon:yes gene_type:complete
MSLFLILLAAGDSKRLRSNTPKPFHKINNKRLIEHSIASFNEFQEIKKTVIVYNRKHKKFLDKIKLKNTIKVKGGRSRQESTFNALKKIRKMNCTKILIHDAARPNPSKLLIKNLINKIKKKHAVIPIIKINDATKRAKKDVIFKNIQRGSLRFAQTPQGYTYKKIYEMHKKNHNLIFDDDSAMFTNEGINVTTIKGSKKNLKITDKEDLDVFKSLKKGKVYTGIGFDIHRLTKNRKLYLGGVKIPFKLGLKGHSDGDPVLHALIDSLLGACRLGDIGKFFSNTNKKYKNIRSTILLSKVVNLINSKNFLINNVDINIITQKPKMKKYIKKIIKTLSKLLDINSNQINIKAKTTEKLGLIGKEKAIASEVISSVIIYD